MAKHKRSSVTVSVDVDMDEIVESLTDEEILDMAEKIGHSGSPREVVVRAITAIRTGRIADGITMLEREFLPSRKSEDACWAAYRLAMKLEAA